MKSPEPDPDLYARLEFLLIMTKRRYSGAELAILTRVTLGQPVSSRELGLTGQGYKRALDTLQSRKLVGYETPLRLHAEACAEFGIRHNSGEVLDASWLQSLAAGTMQRRPVRNLYLLNADGTPASDEQMGQLRDQLFEAAVLAATALTDLEPVELRRDYERPEMSLESEMRALASFVMGFVESRFPNGLRCSLSRAIQIANSSLMPAYPKVLDPHALLERYRYWLRAADDRRIAGLRRMEKMKKRAENPKPGEQSGSANDTAAPPA